MRRFLRWIRSLIDYAGSGENEEEKRNPPEDGSPPTHTSALDELLSLHQRYASLERSVQLDDAAAAHVEYMSRMRRLSHDRLMSRVRDSGFIFRSLAENVAQTNQPDASQVFQLWLDSPGHRRNIESSHYSQVGLALKVALSGEVYWCVIFAS